VNIFWTTFVFIKLDINLCPNPTSARSANYHEYRKGMGVKQQQQNNQQQAQLDCELS